MVVPSDYADEYDKLFNDFSDKDLDSISFAPFSYDGKHLVISIVTTKEARSNPKRLPPHFTVDINGEKRRPSAFGELEALKQPAAFT